MPPKMAAVGCMDWRRAKKDSRKRVPMDRSKEGMKGGRVRQVEGAPGGACKRLFHSNLPHVKPTPTHPSSLYECETEALSSLCK
jgi:hypothetical protein